MGNSQSQSYDNGDNISDNAYNFTINIQQARTLHDGSTTSGSTSNTELKNYVKAKEAKAKNLLKLLDANMKMYMIYDNYDTKNEVILKDLKKKAENQETELKSLTEDRDKLKSVLDYDKTNEEKYDKSDKIIKVINILLFLTILGLIALIIYRIMTHPSLLMSKNLTIEDLENLDENEIAQLSNSDLEKLGNIINSKMNNIGNEVNQVNEVNEVNSASNSNNSNNITKSNLNKKNKLSLSEINSNK